MERPNSSGSGAPQVLHLLACKKVPVGAEQVWVPKHLVIHDRHWTHHRITNCLQRQGPIASLINSRQLTETSSHALWPPFSMPGFKIPLTPRPRMLRLDPVCFQVTVPKKFQPRSKQAGITMDPRHRQIWQERDNGECSWDVDGWSFHQACGLGAQEMCISIMS